MSSNTILSISSEKRQPVSPAALLDTLRMLALRAPVIGPLTSFDDMAIGGNRSWQGNEWGWEVSGGTG